mmetsp:Transcript_1558/g.1953  ORF Transcript_1558/g.1953 Transcript_1558/m.1953 type:complete len:218 (-) Transcript_1558:756-1409(-)
MKYISSPMSPERTTSSSGPKKDLSMLKESSMTTEGSSPSKKGISFTKFSIAASAMFSLMPWLTWEMSSISSSRPKRSDWMRFTFFKYSRIAETPHNHKERRHIKSRNEVRCGLECGLERGGGLVVVTVLERHGHVVGSHVGVELVHSFSKLPLPAPQLLHNVHDIGDTVTEQESTYHHGEHPEEAGTSASRAHVAVADSGGRHDGPIKTCHVLCEGG